jgi:protein TonB
MFCPRSLLLPAILAVSAAAHAGVFVGIAKGPRTGNIPSIVELTVAPAPKPAPPPPPPPRAPSVEPTRVAPSAPRAVPTRRVAARVAAPPQSPSPAQPLPPVDFTGTTLTNDSGDAWAAQTGNGAPLDGPIAAPRAAPAERPAARSAEPAGPAIVALADLSRAPRAPDLDASLAHHYPAAARQRGIAGKAVVRARIAADGKARVLSVVSETFEGFGAACRRTLDGSRWDPPQDRSGQPVTTELTYTCRFEVGS